MSTVKVLPPLLLIPGVLCDETLGRAQVNGLKDCVEIFVAELTRYESIHSMAEAALERVPERFCLAGFSLGSQVALKITEIANDRIEKLALLSATNRGVPAPVRTALAEGISMIEGGHFEAYLEHAYAGYVDPSRVDDQVLRGRFVEMARAVGAQAGVRQMRALLAIHSPFTHLGEIRCPTVIVGGQGDRRIPAAAHQELAREIRGSTLRMIPDSGHFTPIETPESVTEVMRAWLTI